MGTRRRSHAAYTSWSDAPLVPQVESAPEPQAAPAPVPEPSEWPHITEETINGARVLVRTFEDGKKYGRPIETTTEGHPIVCAGPWYQWITRRHITKEEPEE